MPGVKNVVLVQGAWADRSRWSKRIPLRQAKFAGRLAPANLGGTPSRLGRGLAGNLWLTER
jgi:hypothetical protein